MGDLLFPLGWLLGNQTLQKNMLDNVALPIT